ncbi:glycosyltransferase [Brevibacterium album]|uniref:glycosyltransferase n=1 Tax=Brevibacterium album TaxID=417948 RepID=UPI0004083A4B|nr:glycosyltransferase [Brevibacterium album]
MRILLWHVHGSWTDAFVHGRHEYLLPALPGGGPWGLGRGGRDWPPSARELGPEELADAEVDLVLLQRPEEREAAARLLGRTPGRDVPAVYVEHNTPRGDVPDSVHPLADQRDIPLVHVTHFNRLMWDSGSAPAEVIEHGIRDPGPLYTGEIPRLAFVGNEPVRRWRVTGADLLAEFARTSPIDVFGMGAEDLQKATGLGSDRLRVLGDLPRCQLHRLMARRRIYLHPVRWTSLGLSLLEAMHLAMPVLALAATEAGRAVPPDAGTVSADPGELAAAAGRLLAEPEEAAAMGRAGRAFALERYGLERFLRDWDELLDSLLPAASARTERTCHSTGSPGAAPRHREGEARWTSR